MAQVKTDPIRIDDPSKASSGWLSIIEDVFPRWRDRLGSKEAASELEPLLLCDPETRSTIRYVDASGREVPGTPKYLDAEFWRGRLLLVPDADGGADHLVVNYTPSVHVEFELPEGGHWEFFVRRDDVAHHERLYFPTIAAPPKSPATRKKPESESRRSETAPRRFSAWAAEYKKGLNGANPAMDRFIALTRDKYEIKGHRDELRDAYRELFPDPSPRTPAQINPPKINPPK